MQYKQTYNLDWGTYVFLFGQTLHSRLMEAALSLYPVVCAKFDVHYFQECLVLGCFNF